LNLIAHQYSMVRILAFIIATSAMLAAGPAAAQSGVFGNSPPRPPADIPNGFPPQPPPVQYPGGPPPSNIQTQPLAPPPGATAAPPPPQRPRPAPTPALAPLPAPASPPPPQPADTSPKPEDTVITETPTQKIENARAVFSGLDKITGRIISFDEAIGETVQFGALQVTTRACYTRPPTEATNTDAFVEVDEVTLKGEIKRIFTGWMFALSPGLHAVEHPIYDVWLTTCEGPQPMANAQPAAPPAPAAAVAPPRPRQPAAPRPQPAPAVAPVAPLPPR
jgi:hypothetical protein